MKNLLFYLVDGTDKANGAVLIDGVAPGKFYDMHGNEVNLKKEDFPAYVKNTKTALQSTVDNDGVLVGFPIDTINHEHGEAAGWIKDVSLSESGDVIQISVEWNDLGKESIGKKIMRYFSPNLDLEEKVIFGGSLTNWPATRTKKHELLLKPVSLSMALFSLEGTSLDEKLQIIRDSFYKQFNPNSNSAFDWTIYPVEVFDTYVVCRYDEKFWKVNFTENEEGDIVFDSMDLWKEVKRPWVEMALEKLSRVLSGFKSSKQAQSDSEVNDMEVDFEKLNPEQKTALLSQARVGVIAEMQATPPAELAALIETRTAEGVQVALAVEKRKSHVAEFSARVIGGTAEKPVGLPVAKDALENILLSLPEDKQAEVEKMLSDILEKGTVPFTELGHQKLVDGNKELPAAMAVYLQKWVDEGNAVEAWFTANAVELGDMSDYNLAAYRKEK